MRFSQESIIAQTTKMRKSLAENSLTLTIYKNPLQFSALHSKIYTLEPEMKNPYTIMKASLLSMITACALGATALEAKVLATVDGEQITEEVFDEIRAQNPGFDFAKLTKEQQKELLDQAINNVLIAKEAKRAKLDTTPEFTKAFEKITQNIKDRLLVQAWAQKQFQEIASKGGASEQDARAYYDSHKADFSKPNVHARHIVVKTEAEAKKIIDELNKTPKNKAESKFIELANKQTVDPGNKQAQNGGDLGVFSREQMVKPFSDAAFSMSEGTYSKAPVKTEFGYHVIYVISKADKLEFDAIKQPIIGMLNEQRVAEAMKRKVDDLRAKAKVQITN